MKMKRGNSLAPISKDRQKTLFEIKNNNNKM